MTQSYAVYSGLCASFASLFGKLSGLDFDFLDVKLRYVIKIACFCLMVLLNSLVWTFFVSALQKTKTAVEATAVNTATNYIFSGILGFFAFREMTGMLWWLGISFIVVGIIVISSTSEDKAEKDNR